jgi:uncharacterized membrane protein
MEKERILLARLPIGMLVLVIASILIYFGLAQRLLDRMRLSDKTALAVIAALIVGSFIDIPLSRGNIQASINVGGALVPIGLAVYLLVTAGTTKEWVRALGASVVTGAVVYYLGHFLMKGDPGDRTVIDPLYVYPLVGGTIAYLVGRSRRAAFVAATMGVLSLDLIHWFWLISTRTPGTVNIGGAGAFDSIVIAGLVAILLAEVIGETRERLQGGPESEGRDPALISHLKTVPKQEAAEEKDFYARQDTPNVEKEGEDNEKRKN